MSNDPWADQYATALLAALKRERARIYAEALEAAAGNVGHEWGDRTVARAIRALPNPYRRQEDEG